MRKYGTILGIILIVAVLLSGSAVAQTWHFAVSIYDYGNVSDRLNILNAPNDTYASLGEDGPPPVLGWINLDLGSGNEMGASQDFTVFAVTPVNETYDVSVAPDTNPAATQYVGTGWDTENLTFQTPSTPPGTLWRYIFLEGKTGVAAAVGGDYYYGPDIDAVGWYE